MEEKVAWICMEQNLVGFALDIMDGIKLAVQEVERRGEDVYEELRALKGRCEGSVRDTVKGEESRKVAEGMLVLAREVGSDMDADVYLVNVLRVVDRGEWRGEEELVREVWERVGGRIEGLLEGKDAKRESVDLALRFIDSAPRRWTGDWLVKLKVDVEKVMSAEEPKNGARVLEEEESMEKLGEMYGSTPKPLPRLDEKVKAALELCLKTWHDAGEHVLSEG